MKKKQTQSEGAPGFDWSLDSDKLRIKRNTERYKDMEIADAFADYYNIKGLSSKNTNIQEPPKFDIGEYVKLTIRGVDKKHVLFDQTNFKEEIQCTVNLAQYPRFKNLTNPISIDCKVIAKTNSTVLVDPMQVFYDNFINQYVRNQNYQYSIKPERFQPWTARNLRLVNGGFMGSLRMDKASEFFGKDIFLEVFIPGSQIVVNVEKNFERWVGSDVPFYIINLIEKPGTVNKIIVGSPKEFYKLNARIELMDVFNHYCLEDDEWKNLQKQVFKGKVTGVVHSSNKCGVFVEVGKQTGMIECSPEEILQYMAGQEVDVQYEGFNELMKYNSMVDQMQHVEPYIVEDGILKKFNLKVTFKFAK